MPENDTRAELRMVWERLNIISDTINTNRRDADTNIAREIKAVNDKTHESNIKLERILSNQDLLKVKLDDIVDTAKDNEKKYVTKDSFFPIKAIVYTLMSLISIGVITSILRLVLPHADFTQ